MTIRENIENLLVSGLTAHAVSKETGISRNAVYKLFNGESSIDNITLANAEKLSNYWEESELSKTQNVEEKE